MCEQDTLLQATDEVIYYDDEELDVLADRDPSDYTEQEYEQIAYVFHTLLDSDIIGWCRSLQLRHIELPSDLRDEALIIVREQRGLSPAVDNLIHDRENLGFGLRTQESDAGLFEIV